MRRYKQETIFVRGRERRLVIEDDPRAIAYFRLDEEEYTELKEKLAPITFLPSFDIPVGYAGEIGNLCTTAASMARALQILYQDGDLREQALPDFLAEKVGDCDAVMAGVGFDFLVGRHLERPMLLEAAAFGPEFVSSAVMAEFFGIRSLRERLSMWWLTLVEPCLHGAKSIHYVTSFANFDFTREGEHHILVPYLQEQGLQATFGPAEAPEALRAEAVYIRVGLQFPHTWQAASGTKLWRKIMAQNRFWARIFAGDVRVIPPIGNNFFSSKFWHPLFANPEELERRGITSSEAKQIAAHMPITLHFNHNVHRLLKEIVCPQRAFYLKGVWNYGAYGTRRVHDSSMISKALREILAYGDTPIIVQQEVKPGFLPFDADKLLPDRPIEVRVRVFYHREGTIKVMPPAVRVYYPGGNLPLDSLYLDSNILFGGETEKR